MSCSTKSTDLIIFNEKINVLLFLFPKYLRFSGIILPF